MSKYFRWAELKARGDIDVWEGTTRWGNHDLYPIPKKEKNYGIMGFYSYYAVSAISIYGFTSASAYVSAGLGVWETVGAMIIGSCISSFNSYLGAQVGVEKGLGFTMMTRATFGLWGCLLPLANALIANLVFAGIQAYYGGQAVTLILGAVIPKYAHMKNTLPLSAAITTKDLIGFFIYFVFYMPVVFFVPVHRLRKFLYPSIAISTVALFGIMGWIINQNGGTGPIISSGFTLTESKRAFTFLQCVSSTAAVWSGSGDRLADWTRFGKSRHASTAALITGLPIMLTIAAVLGALTTSAFYAQYESTIWTPLGMLIYVQELNYTPKCRAGTFFAAIGLLSSQIYINVVQNTVGFGMDFAGLAPKYLDMKRSAIILAITAVACNPWRFLTQALVFVEVLNVFAVFSSCTSILLIVDYWIIRGRKWKIPDLYHQDGIYWFTGGWNLRAVAAWVLAVIPSMPGFAYSMRGGDYSDRASYKMYQMTFFIGYPLSTILYIIFSKIWPPPGLGIAEELDSYDRELSPAETVIEGVPEDPMIEKVILKEDIIRTKSEDESV